MKSWLLLVSPSFVGVSYAQRDRTRSDVSADEVSIRSIWGGLSPDSLCAWPNIETSRRGRQARMNRRRRRTTATDHAPDTAAGRMRGARGCVILRSNHDDYPAGRFFARVLMMEKTSWVIAAAALAVAGCNAGSDMDAGAPAAEAGEAGSTPETVAQPQAVQTKPEPALPDGFKPFVDAGGRITQGRCHMDACSWMKWEQLRVVRDSDGEVELAGSVLGGVSDHSRKDGGPPDYPHSADGVTIEWVPAPSAVRYWCSKAQPGMKWGDEPRVALALDPDGFVPGAMESAVRSYFVACHSDLSTGPVDEAIVKYGYRVPGRE